MFDLANQSFTLLIITLLFSLYFKNLVVDASVAGGMTPGDASNRGDFAWSLVHGASYLVVVAISPFLGAAGDAKNWRKEILLTTGVLCAFLTVLLGVLPPSMLVLLAIAYFVANVCYQVGENFLASFLPDVSTPETLGRISATGWAMGYVGAMLLLLIVAMLMSVMGWSETSEWRPFFVFAGLWFLAGMLPLALFVREVKRDKPIRTNIAVESALRVADTFRHARRYRQLVLFLVAFLVYGFGVQVIIGFTSIIAEGFGFGQAKLVLFVLQVTFTAGIAAIATAFFQDRIGAKRTVVSYLVIWLVSAVSLAFLTTLDDPPDWPIWVIGNGLGFGLGGIGTASRSMVCQFTPRQRSAEFFGLWGLSYKLAAAIGVLSFGIVSETLGDTNAMILLASFFAVGLALVLPVNEREGIETARAAERRIEEELAGQNDPERA